MNRIEKKKKKARYCNVFVKRYKDIKLQNDEILFVNTADWLLSVTSPCWGPPSSSCWRSSYCSTPVSACPPPGDDGGDGRHVCPHSWLLLWLAVTAHVDLGGSGRISQLPWTPSRPPACRPRCCPRGCCLSVCPCGDRLTDRATGEVIRYQSNVTQDWDHHQPGPASTRGHPVLCTPGDFCLPSQIVRFRPFVTTLRRSLKHRPFFFLAGSSAFD